MEGLLISAYKMSDETIKEMENKFSLHIGEQVKFRVEIDRSLIGGFVVSIKHHRYDYSIKSELQEMRKFLVEV